MDYIGVHRRCAACILIIFGNAYGLGNLAFKCKETITFLAVLRTIDKIEELNISDWEVLVKCTTGHCVHNHSAIKTSGGKRAAFNRNCFGRN